MEVKQIYSLVNDITGEILGKKDILEEDLSNIVDVGVQIFDNTSVDNYVKSLVNHIGRVIFVNRKYAGNAPSVLMDSWEFGSVLEKIQCDTPEAIENDTWNLVDKQEYKQDIFYKPTVSAKFFNKRLTFEIDMSFAERQVKESFSNAAELNGFISMIYNSIDKSMTIKIDSLIMRTIANMIGETFANDFSDVTDNNYGSSTSIRAVNLLKLYNDKYTKTLTANAAITDADFIRFASYTIGLYVSRMSKISSLFNVGGKDRFTPPDLMHIIMLADFAKASDVYLQSDVYHNDMVRLPKAELVPFWQASGKDYSFANVSDLHIKTAGGKSLEISGVLGVIFDRDALGVTNLDRRVTTNYNAKAEFFTNYYKFDAGYFNDLNENFVVFFVA